MNEPDSWCTFIPLVDVYAGLKTPVCFAGGFLLTPMPDLLRQDRWTAGLSAADRKVLGGLMYAFVVEYETPPAGNSDSGAENSNLTKVQRAKHETAQLANFALWLARPSPACFDLVFDAPRREGGWCAPLIERKSRILCHPRDRGGLLTDADLEVARSLHRALCDLPEESPIGTAVSASWSALQIGKEEVRYLLLWIALEALFAPLEGRDTTELLARRIGRFLSPDHRAAEEYCERARQAFLLKSGIAHGQKAAQPDLAERVHETESLLSRALRKILSSEDLVNRFSAVGGRETLLEGLIAEA